ncbi:hypothetical protein [Methylobacterium sp. CM6257]
MPAFISRQAESMSDNVENATSERLKGIGASRAQVLARSDRLETRLEGLEAGMRKNRRSAAGMLIMMSATTGAFHARVAAWESMAG